MNLLPGNTGHILVIISFISAIVAAFSYFKASLKLPEDKIKGWNVNGKVAFYIHSLSVIGIVAALLYILYTNQFQYHYAWSHSSTTLPGYYILSAFWEGQEGSFLLWLFWNAILGVILIITNRYWEAPVMTVFSLVQVFLSSMILGVIIPGLSLKIGSSPFILLREALSHPIFLEDPNFVPADGNGLNPLLQNYWMVIHPPTLFLGFATTLIPFAYTIAGLWMGKLKEWIRPALPWAIFSASVLGIGILMGGYWAYETLNFGGYWNWDPVENAVYVPWLILVAAIHTMVSYKKSDTALKISIILSLSVFILILYSTFLTRSGILGNASVHSFTDLGLSGQLLIYMLFFTIAGIVLSVYRWKEIPSSSREVSAYSREFWIFMGAAVLCLMGFQVIVATSFPVYNKIGELFGMHFNLALPADQIQYYSNFQLWGGVMLGILSGLGQFFWWKKMDKKTLKDSLLVPVIATLLISSVAVALVEVKDWRYIFLILGGVYTIVANLKILFSILKSSPKLSGGSIAHIGIGLMLLGMLYSSGYSKVVSLNQSGFMLSREAGEDFNTENVILFANDPIIMSNYQLLYKGERYEPRFESGFINKIDVLSTPDINKVVAKRDIIIDEEVAYTTGDTIDINGENTFFEIEYTKPNGGKFTLYPRAQVNEKMGEGLMASPDIKRGMFFDLYTHVSSIPSKDSEGDWEELKETKVKIGTAFELEDYGIKVEKIIPLTSVLGIQLEDGDLAAAVDITITDLQREYKASPIMVIQNMNVSDLPDEISDLGIKLRVLNLHPDTDEVTLGVQVRQKDWVILKAIEKPFINILWIGTLLLTIGFGIATYRRYDEFIKLRHKE